MALRAQSNRSAGNVRKPNEELYEAWHRCIPLALHTVRVLRKRSQEEVADALSELMGTQIDQSFISKIESGSSGVALDRLMAICQVLEWTPAKLMQLADELYRKERTPSDVLLRRARRELQRKKIRMSASN
jgi:transcriptional regulator with XRE-family HTH domain